MWSINEPVTKRTCDGIYKRPLRFNYASLYFCTATQKQYETAKFTFLLISLFLSTRNSLLSMWLPCTTFPLLNSSIHGLGLKFSGRELTGFCFKHAKSVRQSVTLSINLSGIDSCVWLSLSYHCAMPLISNYCIGGLCFSLKQLSEEMWEASLHQRFPRYLWHPIP